MKNPWMSMWLSQANAISGSAMGQAASVGRKQMEVIAGKAAEDMLTLWLNPWVKPASRYRKKGR